MSAGQVIPGLNTLSGLAIAGSMQAQGHDELTHSNQGLNIRIVPASGGTIVSIRKDNTYHSTGDLHVIHDNSDIGAELGKIITLHYLKT